MAEGRQLNHGVSLALNVVEISPWFIYRAVMFDWICWATVVWLSPALIAPFEAAVADRPNILWITAEDMSADLGCYGDSFATTPNLDHLATQSVTFTNAFATAPVCSPARSCLISGLYATSLGTQRLRSHFPVPEWCRPFPAYLRQIGYFTTNNVKTDYNVQNEDRMIRQAWNVNGSHAHWRKRGNGEPFFSVFNLMTTHQSRTSVWSFEQFEREVISPNQPRIRHEPGRVPLPPYYPDTPLVRRTVARYYDCISVMDQQVDQILQELEEDGLAEDTIVFFFADHGMGMPRGKRCLHDSGLHVPLLTRFPAKYRHLAPAPPGRAIDRLVSFVGFAPTVLHLAGAEVPSHMQGKVFLGSDTNGPRDDVFCARDRVDEVFDLSRSVRDSRYLYIRNFMPHHSWMPPERYSDQSAMRRQLFQLRTENRLGPAQMTYAAPTRPAEELYDTQTDPHQIHNLAGSSKHSPVLLRMRSRLEKLILSTRDIGFLPESDAWRRLNDDTPWDLAQDETRYPLRRILDIAGHIGLDKPEFFRSNLNDPDPAVRYWSIIGLQAAASNPSTREPVTSGGEAIPQEHFPTSIGNALSNALRDEAPSVRIAAAGALGGEPKHAGPTLMRSLNDQDVNVVLHAMRTIELNANKMRPDETVIQRLLTRAQQNEKAQRHPNWMFVRFSAEAVLERLGKPLE